MENLGEPKTIKKRTNGNTRTKKYNKYLLMLNSKLDTAKERTGQLDNRLEENIQTKTQSGEKMKKGKSKRHMY